MPGNTHKTNLIDSDLSVGVQSELKYQKLIAGINKFQSMGDDDKKVYFAIELYKRLKRISNKALSKFEAAGINMESLTQELKNSVNQPYRLTDQEKNDLDLFWNQ